MANYELGFPWAFSVMPKEYRDSMLKCVTIASFRILLLRRMIFRDKTKIFFSQVCKYHGQENFMRRILYFKIIKNYQLLALTECVYR